MTNQSDLEIIDMPDRFLATGPTDAKLTTDHTWADFIRQTNKAYHEQNDARVEAFRKLIKDAGIIFPRTPIVTGIAPERFQYVELSCHGWVVKDKLPIYQKYRQFVGTIRKRLFENYQEFYSSCVW